MHLKSHDIGVSQHLGYYSDAVEVTAPHLSWLVLSGTPGMSSDGLLADNFAEQATSVWVNITRAVREADFRLSDVVKVNTTMTNAGDIAAYKDIRKAALGDLKPAFMLAVVNQLVRAEILIEVEVWAAKPVHPGNLTRIEE